ncbi:sigma-70 family RNA polymerase sigma factor [Streptomyces sp. NPDC049040]|uniref:sigma-70 family RNA polymerase sigma factor n=1 Tax=Streptomyces sp. NPDC049040 TaxID=3365593 RepID=UPI00371FAD13
MEVGEDEVLRAMVAANGYTACTIDLPRGGAEFGDTGPAYADSIGACDPAMELLENLHALAPPLGGLDDRERRILQLRFGQDMAQREIGAELGCSQMHVSRLPNAALAKLRAGLLTEH